MNIQAVGFHEAVCIAEKHIEENEAAIRRVVGDLDCLSIVDDALDQIMDMLTGSEGALQTDNADGA